MDTENTFLLLEIFYLFVFCSVCSVFVIDI